MAEEGSSTIDRFVEEGVEEERQGALMHTMIDSCWRIRGEISYQERKEHQMKRKVQLQLSSHKMWLLLTVNHLLIQGRVSLMNPLQLRTEPCMKLHVVHLHVVLIMKKVPCNMNEFSDLLSE